jgi:hypothetical protein
LKKLGTGIKNEIANKKIEMLNQALEISQRALKEVEESRRDT